MANENKLFKGILQYKSTDEFTKQAGYIYFVREMSGSTPTGNAEIFFGTRKYGDIQATQLKALEEAISANTSAISANTSAISANTSAIEAIEATLGEWADNLGTVASAVVAVSGATQTNATNIKSLQDSLAEGGATAKAIADAQTAADNAQAEVDALEGVVASDKAELQGNIDKKLAISDFNTYSAATKTAYEQAAATAEQNAKDHADGLNTAMNERVDDLEAASHTHSNKELLDNYTQTEEDLADAVDKKHKHANKAELDLIAEGDKAKWDKATSDIDAFLKGEAISGSTVDTLKEIQNYITSDGQAAADMLSAIASAQTAADNAQAEVDALEDVVDEKLAISDFNTYSAATKTAYEKVASDEADAAEAAAKAYVDAISADTRLDALEAISADTRLDALEAISGQSHTHDNKTVLDGISAAKVAAWDGAEQNAKDHADEAVSDAKDELQGKINEKLAISDFNTYSGATDNTLAQIQSALTQAVKSVTGGDGITVTEGKEVTVSAKVSAAEGNLITVSEDGLYAAMYYGGDDAE